MPRTLTFASPDTVREMYERYGADRKLEDKAALEYAINMVRGSMWLHLTDDEYAKLKTRLNRSC